MNVNDDTYHDTKGKTQARRKKRIAILNFEILLAGELADNDVDADYRRCFQVRFGFSVQEVRRGSKPTSKSTCCQYVSSRPGYCRSCM
jgi:hypothetical protein